MSVEAKTLDNQHFPSAFLRWFADEFGRAIVADQPEDEATFKAWRAGYECCFAQHPPQGRVIPWSEMGAKQ